MSIPLSALPARYQNQVAAQMNERAAGIPKVEAERKPRLRQKREIKLNKTEAAFLAYAQDCFAAKHFTIHQQVQLVLANGVRYYLDFLVVENFCDGVCKCRGYETKGFMRDDAAVKIKVAASVFPWIKFHLVTKTRNGGWSFEEVVK